jgi:hypothetical protein
MKKEKQKKSKVKVIQCSVYNPKEELLQYISIR